MSVDPLTLAIASSVASAGLSAMGASAAADAEQRQLDYQSKVAQNNADIAEDNRQRAIQAASIEAADVDQSASAALGQMVATAGASGLSLTSGSKAAKVSSARKLSARDRARIINEGAIEGGRFAQERTGFENRRTNLLTARSAVGQAGRMNVLSSLVSGASQVSSLKFQASLVK